MSNRYCYNVHDIVTITSEGVLPELTAFLVPTNIEEPNINVRIGIPRKQAPSQDGGPYIRYREILGTLGFEVGIQLGRRVEVVASPSLRLSPHVLYTNVVEPILRWELVGKGYALVHGASLAFGSEACLITARTDTGKTTTLLKILATERDRSRNPAAFLSDDMTIVSRDGVALTYPKPLTISYHTLRAIDKKVLPFKERMALPIQSRVHSRSGRRAAFFIGKTHLPAATINMVVQMLVPPPKYFVDELVPNARSAQRARLSRLFIIERGQPCNVPVENSEAMAVLLRNCEDAYGFPPYEDLKEFLYRRGSADLRKQERAIIRQALGALPAQRIRSNTFDWWSHILTAVDGEYVPWREAEAVEAEDALQPSDAGAA